MGTAAIRNLRKSVGDESDSIVSTIMHEVGDRAWDCALSHWAGEWPTPNECFAQGMREGLGIMIRLYQSAPLDDADMEALK